LRAAAGTAAGPDMQGPPTPQPPNPLRIRMDMTNTSS
jgi:hypothetical protein